MKLFFAKARGFGAQAVRLCGHRFLVLAVALAVSAGSLLAVPVFAEDGETTVKTAAEQSPAEQAETPVGAVIDPLKLLEQNIAAINKATLLVAGNYTGKILPLRSVTVTADETTTVLCLPAGTTADEAVKAAGITRGEEDYLNVPDGRFVSDDLVIEVTRVSYREYTKNFSISYKTETKYTSDLRQGASKVQRAGVAGVRTVTYRERIENGKVISTKTVKEEVTKQPVNKIILKGTKVGRVVSEAPMDIPLDSAGQPLKFAKKLTGKATAYTSDRGDSGSRTALGGKTQVGVVAVDPRVIPYGTKLWIVSPDGTQVYGYAVAGDTGGAVRTGAVLVDLYFDTYGECSRFGRRTMNVYILE